MQWQWQMSLGERRWELLLLAELPGEQLHAVCCALYQPVHGDVGWGKLELEEGLEGGEHLDGQGGQ